MNIIKKNELNPLLPKRVLKHDWSLLALYTAEFKLSLKSILSFAASYLAYGLKPAM